MSDEVSITIKQLEEMRHALGLGTSKTPYRNRFFIHKDNQRWNDLVSKGLATKEEKGTNNDVNVYFFLTKRGAEIALGRRLSDKVFKEVSL